jgi:serine/threonine protein kinase
MTKRLVAYKLINVPNEDARRDVIQEIAILLAVAKCPQTLKIVDASPRNSTEPTMFIITEYYNGGTLSGMIREICKPSCTIRVTLLVMRDLALALECMHSAGYVHMDVKPDNVLVSMPEGTSITQANAKFRFVLADYGLAQRIGHMGDATGGSPMFMSPESLPRYGGYTGPANAPPEPSRDIWALGVLLYFMFYKRYPFVAKTLPELAEKLRTTEPEFKSVGLPGQTELLKSMLNRDPTARPTATQVLDKIAEIIANMRKAA